MSTQTLRPNATLTNTLSPTYVGGSSNPHVILSDDTDTTYMIIEQFGTLTLAMGTYALASGERVKRWRFRLRGNAVNKWADDTKVHLMDSTSGNNVIVRTTNMRVVIGPQTTIATGWFSDGLSLADQQDYIDALRTMIRPETTTGDNATNAGLTLYELYLDLDIWQNPDTPTVGITEASAGVVNSTDAPTVEVHTAALNEGTPSFYSRQVRIFRDAVYLAAGFDPENETDVEWEQTDTSLPSISTNSGSPDELQVGEPLANSDTYRAYVRIGKNDVAGETLWTGWASSEFELSLSLPDAPAIGVRVEQPRGRQSIEVTTAALTHDTLERLRVERSDDGGDTWATIRGGLLTGGTGSTLYTFHDYDAPRGVAVQYRARITEGVAASDTTLTSDWAIVDPVVHPNDGHPWLYDVGTWDHVGVYTVMPGLSRQPSEQAGVFQPLGRRTAVVVTAGRTADTLAWNVWADDRDHDVEDVEALLTSTQRLLVKWPEGNQDYVRVTSRSMEYEDIGNLRRRRWSVQVVEVDDGITADG